MVAAVRNGLLRAAPDETYADGDDSAWMDVDWSTMQLRVPVLGRDVNVLDTGTPSAAGASAGGEDDPGRPPLLFLHGWSANWQSWLLTIPAFMDTHRCIALDLPGFGHSDMPAEPVSIHGYARTVDALCSELGVERVVVVGNSMGGFVGAELALAFPTRVERLVLVSAAGLSIEDAPREPLRTTAKLFAASHPYASYFTSFFVSRPRLRRATMQFVVRYPEKLSAPLAYELVLASGKPGFLPALDALLGHSYRDRLAQIEIPVLIVWGRNDMLVPAGDARRYAELIGANARRVIFDDTGHAPMIERPSRFNALLREFLEGDPVPEAGIAGVGAGAGASG
jgi:pimeloyl-ACP methyl ester carboxylesterase